MLPDGVVCTGWPAGSTYAACSTPHLQVLFLDTLCLLHKPQADLLKAAICPAQLRVATILRSTYASSLFSAHRVVKQLFVNTQGKGKGKGKDS